MLLRLAKQSEVIDKDSEEIKEECQDGKESAKVIKRSKTTNYHLEKSSHQHMFTSSKDRQNWTYLFHASEIGDF